MSNVTQLVEVLSPQEWLLRLHHPPGQAPVVEIEPVEVSEVNDEV